MFIGIVYKGSIKSIPNVYNITSSIVWKHFVFMSTKSKRIHYIE